MRATKKLYSYLQLTEKQMKRLDHYIDASIVRHGDRIAILTESEQMTYRDFGRAIDSYAAELESINCVSDEPLIVLVDNRPLDLAKFVAAWRMNVVPVPVSLRSKSHTVDLLINQSRARYVLGDEKDFKAFPESAAFQEIGKRILCCKHSLERPDDPALEGAALVVFTSGTTGIPKGVVQSHEAYCSKLEQIYEALPFNENAVNLMALQLTFSFGQWSSFLTLARGASLLLMPRFSPDEVCEILATRKITWFPVVPTLLRILLPALREKELLKGPELILTGGEILPVQLGRDALELFNGSRFTDVYGLTETNSADFILTPHEFSEHVGTIGRPSAGVSYRIVDSDCNDVPKGEVGELWVNTPFRMKGYLHQTEMTAQTFNGEYLKTGDLGRERTSGVVELVGRSKEIINKGGLKVSPLEIEAAFLSHPEIRYALACGAASDDKGEEIHLCIIPESSEPSASELLAWGREKLEHFKVPAFFYSVESLPQGQTGKTDRISMSALVEAGALRKHKIESKS